MLFRSGAYILSESDGVPDVVLVATGSEVALAMASKEALETDSLSIRVVSMPSWELFESQPEGYRLELFPPDVQTLAIEAGITQGWQDRKSTRLNSSHKPISYAGFCLKKKAHKLYPRLSHVAVAT